MSGQSLPMLSRSPHSLALALIPIAPALSYFFNTPPIWIFLSGAAACAVLADVIRRLTEQLAGRVGPAIGGLLEVSFGSVAELVLALFVLFQAKTDVVRAQITGSIICSSLFGLGVAIVVGDAVGQTQLFRRERAGPLSTMLFLSVIALLLPAVFNLTSHDFGPAREAVIDENLSIAASVVLILLYGANVGYTLLTDRDLYSTQQATPQKASSSLSMWMLLGLLMITTGVLAFEAGLISNRLEAAATALGFSPIFIGVIVLALVGNASDVFAAACFAREGKLEIVLTICIGSAIQVALLVAPLLVLISVAIGHPMTLVFHNPLDLFAIAGTAFIVNSIAADGQTSWIEGVLLIGVYVLLGVAFFFVP